MQLKNKVLIFGSTGQDGYYLSRILEKNNIEYIGISRNSQDISGDVSDFEFVHEIIREVKPSYIFHFAATSSTKHENLLLNFQSISRGTLNILESVRISSPHSRVFISGSAVQFKNMGLPIDELTPFDPMSAYSVARIHSVYTSRYFREHFGLKVFIGYFFNHDSPLRGEQHVNQKIVRAVNRIAKGSGEKLELGDIEVKKEFNFAGDIAQAVWTLVNQEKIYECVLGCGEVHSIKEWLEYCFSFAGLNWMDHVIPNQNFTREYEILISNPKLIKELGWKPAVGFFQLADMMLKGLSYDV